jgi:RNA polymerase sigma-70 factor, ECF subfamily
MEVIYTLVATPSEEPQISLDVSKAIDGDADAFGRVYQLYIDRIYRYVYYHVRDKMTAEDVTNEVFIRAWKSIGNCKGRESTFSSWLYRIARNHSIDTLQKNRREVSFDNVSVPDTSDPEKEAEDNMDLQNVLEAVKGLPEQQKQVILLKFLDDIENDEIARIMGKRQGAVRALQMRALINLRKKFESGAGSDGG